MATVASYYSRRAARDPTWHEAQLAGAREREAERRAANLDGFRECAPSGRPPLPGAAGVARPDLHAARPLDRR
jgi:hypothetical protein